jgi:tRNA (guanine-N7-)-methyltransferase
MPHAAAKTNPAAPPAFRAREAARQAMLAATLLELYPEPVSLVFEVGCGHGHLLAAYAAANPKMACLGVDLVVKRIERAQRKRRRLELKNLAFLNADVMQTLDALPPHVRLTGIFVLFPDPWPKQRHAARRVLQKELLDALAERAGPGAWLAFRSDHAGYFAWARGKIEKHPAWKIDSTAPWPFEHTSYFQEIKGPYQSLVAVRTKHP